MRFPTLNARPFLMLLSLLALAACGTGAPTAEQAAAGPRPTAMPTAPAADSTRPAVAFGDGGQNPNGTFYRGATDAPVTILEYSDFL